MGSALTLASGEEWSVVATGEQSTVPHHRVVRYEGNQYVKDLTTSFGASVSASAGFPLSSASPRSDVRSDVALHFVLSTTQGDLRGGGDVYSQSLAADTTVPHDTQIDLEVTFDSSNP
jgi:hypothetical protein